jgi:ATP-dependent DNA ligase
VAKLRTPVELALARDQRDVPEHDPRWVYEPKFDGWRAILFTGPGVVQSRRNNDLASRFPEIVTAGRKLGDLVLDGELVALAAGRLEFGALTSMPAGRAQAGITIYYVVFDLLAQDGTDLRDEPYRVRRDKLQTALSAVRAPIQLIPCIDDRALAMRWMRSEVAQVGIEGVVVKDVTKPYRPGRTGDWRKIRQRVVVDAVVIGVTGPLGRPVELVLARPAEDQDLQLVGLSLPLSPGLRAAITGNLTSTGEPRRQLPGGILGQEGTEYQPVQPTLVVEVETEPTVSTFNNRLRPRVHRLRLDLTVDDLST